MVSCPQSSVMDLTIEKESDVTKMDVTNEKDGISDMDSEDIKSEEILSKKGEVIPVLELLSETESKSHNFSFVNELKLSDFKMVLSKV